VLEHKLKLNPLGGSLTRKIWKDGKNLLATFLKKLKVVGHLQICILLSPMKKSRKALSEKCR